MLERESTPRRWLVSVIGVFSLTLVAIPPIAAQPQARQVLLLNSFERGSATENLFAAMLRTELGRQSGEPINFFEVSLQPALAPDDPREGPVVEYLESTFGHHLDLVITLGGPAAEFAQRYREQIFPSTPLLLTAMDHRWVQGRTLADNETALGIVTDPALIVAAMLRVLPDTRTIFVIIGASRIEELWTNEFKRRMEPFQDRVTFLWSNELSFEDILKRSASLPANSAIFYALLSVDAEGAAQQEERTLAELHAAANAPMFGLYDIQVGHGIVGGPLISVEEAVRNASAAALRLLRGESPGSIETAPQLHGRPTFDWRELRRWGIDDARLPAGSVVRFQPPSVWNEYKAYIISAAMILALQSALIAGLVFQGLKRRRTELALRRSYQQNQDLAGRLIHAQEEERTRIARDLHDDLSQQLAGLAIMLSGLKRQIGKPGAEPEMDQTVTTLRDRTLTLTDSVRTLSHQLHPAVLVHVGLVATLRRHCGDIARHHQLTVSFKAGDGLDSLGPDVALCLFRVTQEALTNAVRHARPGMIAVQLSRAEHEIELSVIDDGVGFVAGERFGSGLGLRSIDERVRLTGGSVRVESRPGHGTKVWVRIPLPAPVLAPAHNS